MHYSYHSYFGEQRKIVELLYIHLFFCLFYLLLDGILFQYTGITSDTCCSFRKKN